MGVTHLPTSHFCRTIQAEIMQRGINVNIPYIRSGDYFIPDLKLPEETRPIGKWGRLHRDYLKEYHPVQFNTLVLSCNLWTP